ncbi:MAG: type II secretion system protein [Candidatus Pacebacteria bacterium]|nr:type II secretion system protein [Candidatus Paceibacterota bacterium]
MKFIRSLLKPIASVAGFTMIELLIVISILGILAVAVLSAINPIEQINRGRDTGSQSDAEQLISAADRYNAFQGHYPWQADPSADFNVDWTEIGSTAWTVTTDATCKVLDRLGSTATTAAGCTNSNEIKSSFTSRITAGSYNSLFVYNRGEAGDSTYVCFEPKSDAFAVKATGRCDEEPAYGNLPPDFPATNACGTTDYYCLP